jgi:hypothetical protein
MRVKSWRSVQLIESVLQKANFANDALARGRCALCFSVDSGNVEFVATMEVVNRMTWLSTHDPTSFASAWGYALIMIVLASLVMYSCLAPKRWREWASAGLVQAFIIALYAEMYLFPLTIYLLVRFFRIDRTYVSPN